MTRIMDKDASGGLARPLSVRERMVRSAAGLIRVKGVSGTGLREVVADAAAPRGSLQHYFPGGKDQLVSEALLWMGAVAARHVVRFADRLDPPTPGRLFAAMADEWRVLFLTSGYAAGCPLVAAVADAAATNEVLRDAAGRAFEGWQGPLASTLIELGVPAARSSSLALLMISALEGAIVLARTRRDVAPLDVVAAELAPLLDAATGGRGRTRTAPRG